MNVPVTLIVSVLTSIPTTISYFTGFVSEGSTYACSTGVKWEFRIWCIICSIAFLFIILLVKKFPLTAELNSYIEAQLAERDEKSKVSSSSLNQADTEAAIKTKQSVSNESTGFFSKISIFPIDFKKDDSDDVNIDLQHLSVAEIYDIGREPSTSSLQKNPTLNYLYYSNLFSITGLLAALAFVSLGIHYQIQQPASDSLSLLGTIVQIIVVLFLYELFRGMSLNSLYKLSSELLNSKAAALSEKLLSTPSDIKSSLNINYGSSSSSSSASVLTKPSDTLLKSSQPDVKIFSSKYYILGFPFEKYSVYYFLVLVFCLFWIIVGIIPLAFSA